MHRYIFWEVSKIIQANPKIQSPSLFYSLLKNTYITDMAIGIRRQLDPHPHAISLANLLRELVKYPKVLTRKWFVSLYKGSVAEAWADRDFDKFAGKGRPYIDPTLVEKDLRRLEKLWQPTGKYVDRRIAHLDKKGVKTLPTFKDLDDCMDLLEELLKKYVLLLEAVGLMKVTPTIQDDWKKVFRVAWIPK